MTTRKSLFKRPSKKDSGRLIGDAARALVKARDIQMSKLSRLEKVANSPSFVSTEHVRREFSGTIDRLDRIQAALNVLIK